VTFKRAFVELNVVVLLPVVYGCVVHGCENASTPQSPSYHTSTASVPKVPPLEVSVVLPVQMVVVPVIAVGAVDATHAGT
jgi:predicted Na+-dependent transporter